MDEDIADMEAKLALQTDNGTPALKADPKLIEQAIRAVFEKQNHAGLPSLADFHQPPASFKRGQQLAIAVHASKVAGVRLRYRRVNQAEDWQMIEMERSGKDFRAEIPAAYADSPFPLQYHFQIRDGSGKVGLLPGLNPGWQGQPYYVVRQAA